MPRRRPPAPQAKLPRVLEERREESAPPARHVLEHFGREFKKRVPPDRQNPRASS